MKTLEFVYATKAERDIEVVNARAQYRRAGVWITRGRSKLANPFIEGRDGNREEVVQKYHQWLRAQWKQGGNVKAALLKLVRHPGPLVLKCWCDPLPCHGHVLKHAIEGIRAQEAVKKREKLKAQA